MNIALIVAAGRGHRLGGPLPKQYLPLNGGAILRHTILAWQTHPDIHAVQVLIHPDDLSLYVGATKGLALRPPLHGGATRQESVRNGLLGIADLHPANVLIHDAVRPFIGHATIGAVLASLSRHPGALACVAVTDTLKRVQDGMVMETIDRGRIFRAQTPQGFRYADILAAHQRALREVPGIEFTDDSMIAEFAGLAVEMVPDSETNFKITTAQDLRRAETQLSQEETTK